MKTRLFSIMSLVAAISVILLLTGVPLAQAGRVVPVNVNPASPADIAAVTTYKVYLPLVTGSGLGCSTGQGYSQGPVYQYDTDNPVRPAYNHADKNLALRSYAIDNSLTNSQKQIAALYAESEPLAPNLRGLFVDNRIPNVLNVYDVYDWNWANPPNPGTRGSGPVATTWPITVLGVQVTQGETIRVPSSGYDLGAGVEAIVLYADSNRITIHYTRQDSTAVGYSIHIENICVDPNLLALYNSLDGTARNGQLYPGTPDNITDYNLVTLTALQPIGKTSGTEMQIVIRDTGGFMDPRSLNDWWG